MLAKPKADKKTGLLRLVEERALSRKRLNLVPYLPKEIVSDILLRLPPESLQSSRFVCKAWHKITLTHDFIDTHLSQTEPVIIFQTSVKKESAQEKPKTFSVEAKLLQKNQSLSIFPQPEVHPSSNFCLKFLAIKDGKINIGEFNVSCLGKIRASCNGLILLDDKVKKGGLIVMNPVTKELCGLPPGTLFPPDFESYGLAYCERTREYKLVHLFRDEMGFIGCEILTLGTRSWRAVDGPSTGLFKRLWFHPVFAFGSLHWIDTRVDQSDFVVSMEVDEEKFHKTMLPTRARFSDTILEMGGLLCFVTRVRVDQIDVWVLKELHGADWTKSYSISITQGWSKGMVPLYARFNGEIVFRDGDGFLYAYDFQLKVVKKVEMEKGFNPVHGSSFPHVNSIVSWRKVENGEDVW